MDEETKNKIKQLEDRIAKLETRRILQMDIMPQVVKYRHIDWNEINTLNVNRDNKKVIIEETGKLYFGTDTNLYRDSANYLKTDDSLIIGTDFIASNCDIYGDVHFLTAIKGPMLIDRVTATTYRLKVTSGVLGVEAV